MLEIKQVYRDQYVILVEVCRWLGPNASFILGMDKYIGHVLVDLRHEKVHIMSVQQRDVQDVVDFLSEDCELGTVAKEAVYVH